MRHVWFRLCVRLLGLLLIGLSLTSLFEFGYTLYAAWRNPYVAEVESMIAWSIAKSSSILQALLGVYLLTGGGWIVRYCLRDADTTCSRCGYDVKGIVSAQCPECGLRLESAAAAEQNSSGSSSSSTTDVA